jgi:hypothetical protein
MNNVKRKSLRLKKKKNRVLYMIAGLVIGIFILTAGTMAMMVSEELDLGKPPKRIEEPHLYVEDVFFMNNDVRADDEVTDLSTTVYITNDGLADANDVKIIAYPLDTKKNLAHDDTETTIGHIPKQKTSTAEFIISVPAGAKHEVELLIFEDGRLILRGSGSVVTEGSSASTEKYKTREVKGTSNDKDYDGLPDNWELYYGLDPTNPDDAFYDPDNDGMTNIEEYYYNSTPTDANKKGETADGGSWSDDENSSLIGGFVVVFVVIVIIIIVLAIGAAASKPSGRKVKNNITDNPSTLQNDSGDKKSSMGYPPYYKGPWLCPRCHGMINHDTCTRCGTKYPDLSEIENPPEPVVIKTKEHDKNLDE